MKKIIKKWGSSLVVVFDKEDIKINPKIKEGAVINLNDLKIEDKGDKNAPNS